MQSSTSVSGGRSKTITKLACKNKTKTMLYFNFLVQFLDNKINDLQVDYLMSEKSVKEGSSYSFLENNTQHMKRIKFSCVLSA